MMAVMMLMVLQTMTSYLRTGFGVLTVTYGGNQFDPTIGLAQGNGAPSLDSTGVSTVQIEAYRQLGHGAELMGAWSGLVFYLAAILYVDNSYRLHMAKSPTTTDTKFFEDVQTATMDWGGLMQTTGGSLKSSKYFWNMMAWHWNKGVSSVKIEETE